MSDIEKALHNQFVAPGPEDVDDVGLLEYTVLNETLLGEYHAASEKLKEFETIKERLRKEILRLSGEQRGAVPMGKWTLVLKPRGGSCSVDWEKFVEDELGAKALKEMLATRDLVKGGKADSKYVKVGKESITLEVMENEKPVAAPAKKPEERPEY